MLIWWTAKKWINYAFIFFLKSIYITTWLLTMSSAKLQLLATVLAMALDMYAMTRFQVLLHKHWFLMIFILSIFGKDSNVITVVVSVVYGKWINSYSSFPLHSIKGTNWRISSQTYTSDNVFAAGCVCKWFRQCIEYT